MKKKIWLQYGFGSKVQRLLSNSLGTWLNSSHFGSKAKKRGSHRKPFPFRVGLAAASSKNLQLCLKSFPHVYRNGSYAHLRPQEYSSEILNIQIMQHDITLYTYNAFNWMPNNSLRNNELPPECTQDQYELSPPTEIGRESEREDWISSFQSMATFCLLGQFAS